MQEDSNLSRLISTLDDFRQRTKASKTVIDTMVELGILADLPASNQLSLFDF